MEFRVLLYQTKAGATPVQEFLDGLSKKDRGKVLAAVDYLGQEGPALRRPHVAHVQGKLWELRISRARNEFRVLYYFRVERQIVLLKGFQKKTQAIPQREIEVAEKRKKEYEERIREGEVTL